MKSTVSLNEQMHFTGEVEGFEFPLDADPQHGGQNKGPRPKTLALTSLAGCTAMDVIAILRKMKVEPETFSVEAESELTDDHPRVFDKIRLTYRFKGTNLPRKKLEKAITLSQERYCGMSAMLRVSVPLEWEILIEE